MVMINSLVQCFKDTGNTQFDELFSLILHLGVVLKNNDSRKMSEVGILLSSLKECNFIF